MNSWQKTHTVHIGLLVLTILTFLVMGSAFLRDIKAAEQREAHGTGNAYVPIVLSSLDNANPLFSEFLADTQLTDEQQSILDNLGGAPTTTRLSLVKIDVNLLRDAKVISLNLFTDTVVDVYTDRIEYRADDDFTWFGNNASIGTSAVIVVEQDDVIGTVIHENALYKIVPIGESVHANAKVDFGRQGDEHPSEYDQMERESSDKHSNSSSSLRTVDQIRLLVVYTPASTKEVATMDALVRLAVEETIQSFRNSNITKEVLLVYRTKIDYDETGDMARDLERLRTPGDGYMDSIFDLRTRYNANIVMLIGSSNYGFLGTSLNAPCGLASAIDASYGMAFAIVNQSCATGYYSFGHEMGHLLGARHNPEVDPTDDPYSYGHGYLNPANKWRTIMAYDCDKRCTRLPYWSNPDVVYRGDPMGTEARHNNARVLNLGSSKPPTATPKPPTATPKPPTATPKPPTATPKPASAELVNPSFESGRREPWTFLKYNNACNWMVYNWPNVAKDGQYLLATNENSNNPDCSGFYQDIYRSPQPGETYRFAIWASSAGGPRRGQIVLWALGGQREVASVDFSGIGASWQCIETSLAVQRSDHSSLRVEIYLYSDDSVDYYFDKASLTMNTGPLCPPIAPPTLTATLQPPTATYTPRPPTATHTPPSIAKPDLVVTDLKVTSVSSTDIKYQYTIKNVGSAPANLDGPTNEEYDNVTVQAFLSQDTVYENAGDIPAGGTILGLSPLGYLDPGETFTGSFGAGVSNASDWNYLVLKVDSDNVVEELVEANNTLAASIPSPTATPPVAASRPDLIVTDLQILSVSTSGITYQYTIKNIGTAPANLDGPTNEDHDNVKIQAYLSQDTVYANADDIAAGGKILGLSPLGYLDPGKTFSGSFGPAGPGNASDWNYLVLKVDSGNVVEELVETNNTIAKSVP